MADKNLKLALQVTADLNQARREVKGLNEDIKQISKVSANLTTAQGKTAKSAGLAAGEIAKISAATDMRDGIKQLSDYEIWLQKTASAGTKVADGNQLIDKTIKDLTPSFLSLTAIAGGFVAMAVDTVNQVAELNKQSKLSGLDVQQFQYYSAGAKNVGIATEQLAVIFEDTREKVGDFLATGGGELQQFFDQIAPKVGVTAEQFKSLSGPQALQLYFDSLQKANITQNETIFYLKGLSDQAAGLIPLLQNGGDGFKKYGDQAKAAGAILSQNVVNDALEAKAAINQFQTELSGVKNKLVAEFSPAIAFVAKNLDVLVQAGIVVASLYAGRMVSSVGLATIAFIKGRIEATAYQIALARMAGVAQVTAVRITALSTVSSLLTAVGGLPGLAIAAAGVAASFLLMSDNSDEASLSLDAQAKSVADLAAEYIKLDETQRRVALREQLQNVDQLTDAYNKQKEELTSLREEMLLAAQGAEKIRLQELYRDFEQGNITAKQFADSVNQLTTINDAYKSAVDKSALSTQQQADKLQRGQQILDIYTGKTDAAKVAANSLTQNLNAQGKAADGVASGLKSANSELDKYLEKTKQDIVNSKVQLALIDKNKLTPKQAAAIAQAQELAGFDVTTGKANRLSGLQVQAILDKLALDEKILAVEQKTTKEKEKQTEETKRLVGLVGSTGGSTGNHLDIRYDKSYSGGAISAEHLSRFQLGGKTLDPKNSNSPYGMRTHPISGEKKLHRGYDFAAPEGTEVTTSYPIKDVQTYFDKKGGGYVSKVIFEDGVAVNLLHQIPQMKSRIKGGSSKGKNQSEISNDRYDVFLNQQQDQEKAQKERQDQQLAIRKEYFTEDEKLAFENQQKIDQIVKAGFSKQEREKYLTRQQLAFDANQDPQLNDALKRIKDSIPNLQNDLLKIQGNELEAQLAAIDAKWQPLKNDLALAASKTDNIFDRAQLNKTSIEVDIVIDQEKLNVKFSKAMDDLQQLQNLKKLQLDNVQSRYDSGQISKSVFASQAQDIEQKLNPQIQHTVNLAREVALQMQGVSGQQALAAVEAQQNALSTVQDNILGIGLTVDGLSDRISSGLTDAIMSFADGTKSAGDAFKQFAASFLQEIAQMIIKQLIFNAVKIGLNAIGGGAGAAAGAATTAAGYATGGYTGNGARLEPAGIVHRGEVVINKAVVSQPGMKDFLLDVNKRGFDALSRFRGYAEGGFVTPNVQPRVISPTRVADPAASIAASTSFTANQQFLLVDDPSRLTDYIKSGKGQETLVVMMSRDPAKFRAALKVG